MNPGWILTFGLAGAYGTLALFLPEKQRRRTFDKRQNICFDDLYQTHFKPAGLAKELASQLWKEAALDLGIDEEKLRPDDRFTRELGSPLFPHVELNNKLLDRLHSTTGASLVAHQVRVKTLKDYIIVRAEIESSMRGATC